MPGSVDERITRMSIRNRLGAVAVLAIGVVCLGGSPAQAAPSTQDSQFLQAAHQTNLAEIAVGQLAQQKAASQTVRDLGGRLVTDHTQLDQALQQAATALGVNLPGTPNANQQAVAARLQAASGGAFDQLFVSTQLAGHETAMRLGETELASGSDAQAKKVASDSAPVIKSHHDALVAAANTLGVPTNVNTGSGGRAAPHPPYTVASLLIAVGLLVVAVAGWRLRRPRVRT
jgi:putative membrane protein